MALSILNNIPSLAAQNQLSITGASLQKTLFRLSSGSRINTGADDAAGLAIADGLRANVTALTQSSRNAMDGVGMLQVADGALGQVTSLLNRAVTLATEAATGTVTSTQRTALDTEFTAIKAEIDRIGSDTNFNGSQVFSATALSVFLSDAGSQGSITATTGALSSASLGLGAQATNVLSFIGQPSANDTVTIGTNVFKFVAAASAAGDVTIGADLNETISNLAAAINGGPGAGSAYVAQTTPANTGATAGGATGTTLTITATAVGAAGNSVATTKSGSNLGFLSGANLQGGSGSLSLTTGTSAGSALSVINAAIQSVASTRGSLGASVNRLQSAYNVINNQVQNLSAAEDGIRAADIAQEVANMTKTMSSRTKGVIDNSTAGRRVSRVRSMTIDQGTEVEPGIVSGVVPDAGVTGPAANALTEPRAMPTVIDRFRLAFISSPWHLSGR
jgi:flagellin